MISKNDRPDDKPMASLSDFFCFALYSTSLELTKLYRVLLKELRLTYPQYLVMVVLWEQDHLTVSELGRTLHLDSGTLTPLLKRLEKMGLIKRERNPEDERKVVVSLKRAGDNLRSKARALPRAIICAIGMSSKDAAQLQKMILNARDHVRAYRKDTDPN
jgi:MarR family transcriptional regulator, organic hydroperoxide resistance regulator